MKDRSTAICVRDGRILLVARERSSRVTRWSLPGGKRAASETPAEACRRELMEETSIRPLKLDYLFQFGGFAKRHYDFLAELARDKPVRASNEVTACEWFNPRKIATLPTSIPTREIVAMFIRRCDPPALR
ncbi:CTP pyrophosphohydrolase (plasmid) [Burkholderia sp. AD24]|nr:CTP pyrophosphohydrolase [Burkholderia sp. AD24]